jgi:hypothetical protein
MMLLKIGSFVANVVTAASGEAAHSVSEADVVNIAIVAFVNGLISIIWVEALVIRFGVAK